MNKNITNFVALVKREFIEHRNGMFWIPVILLGLVVFTLISSLFGLSQMNIGNLEVHGAMSLSEGLTLGQEKAAIEGVPLGSMIAGSYWASAVPSIIALVFVVFFGLLGSLYEERRDRSVLFFKSMPISDTEEVVAKLVTLVFGAPLVLLGVVIAGQLLIAVILSLVVLVQGGPVLTLWPLGDMIIGWTAFISFYTLMALWMMPFFAWLLLVSSFAPRMPFVFAVLPPVVIGIMEEVFFGTERFVTMLASRFEDMGRAIEHNLNHPKIHGPEDLYSGLSLEVFWNGLTNSLASGSFWMGLMVAGAMLFGAVEFRKRSLAL